MARRATCILAAAAIAAGCGAAQADTSSQQGGGTPSALRQFTKNPCLNLMPAQERTIYQSTVNAPEQNIPKNVPMIVGGMVPKSIELKALPSIVTEQVSSVKDLRYVKVESDDVLLVDPTNRVIVGIISKSEGMRPEQRRSCPRGA